METFTFLPDTMENRNNSELPLMGFGEILENPGWKNKTGRRFYYKSSLKKKKKYPWVLCVLVKILQLMIAYFIVNMDIKQESNVYLFYIIMCSLFSHSKLIKTNFL